MGTPCKTVGNYHSQDIDVHAVKIRDRFLTAGIPLLVLFIYLFIYLAALGLHCCARAFSSCGERGLLFVAVRGLLIAVASLVVEHGL